MRGPFSISAMIARQDKLVDCLVQQRAVTSSKPAFHESWQGIISIELSVLEFDLGNKVLLLRTTWNSSCRLVWIRSKNNKLRKNPLYSLSLNYLEGPLEDFFSYNKMFQWEKYVLSLLHFVIQHPNRSNYHKVVVLVINFLLEVLIWR